MKKIFLAILILTLITVSVPSLRERANPHVDRMGSFLAGKLEGPLSPVLNPYRRLKSQSEIGELVRELVRHRNSGFVRPRPDVFREYMQEQIEGEDGLDAWGSPYIMIPSQDSMAIVSAGPDLEYETDDDVVVKLRYPAPAYMRGRLRH